jgi:hypothetical protein
MTNEEKIERQKKAKERLKRLQKLQLQCTERFVSRATEARIESMNESIDEFLRNKKEQS